MGKLQRASAPSETIDATDESLMRWHYTNFAQEQGIGRRVAEVQFRTDWDVIETFGPSANKQKVFTAMIRLINSKELS
jgi:hypothetical protein